MIKLAIVANEPPPYRIPIFNRLASHPGVDLKVIFCCRHEPNRFWNLPAMHFEHVYLREKISTVDGRYIHNNPDVIGKLRRVSPDVIVTTGFNPTHLYALSYALAKGIAIVPMTDGTIQSEQTLTSVHRFVRRFVYARADACVYASLGGKKLYQRYGVSEKQCFQSHLCIDNHAFAAEHDTQNKRYDFIFCGRIEVAKNPLFALKVATKVSEQLNRKVSILFVGSGTQLEMLKSATLHHTHWVDPHFHGFAMQEELPALYRSARVFLFPTAADVWGVVANEACAAGVPVIVSTFAGVANELILHNENGFVCELDVDVWAQCAGDLLTQPKLWELFSRRSQKRANNYNFDAAANGLIDACYAAVKKRYG